MENSKSKRRNKSLLIRLLPIGDPAIIVLGFVAAFMLRFGENVPVYNWEPFLEVLPWMCIGVVVFFAALGMYEHRVYSLSQLAGLSTLGVAGIAILTTAATFWLREFAFPRSVIVIAVPLQIILICLWRYGAWKLELLRGGRRKLLVVGPSTEAGQLAADFRQKVPASWFLLDGVITPGDLAGLPGILSGVDGVLVSPSLSREEKAAALEVSLDAGKEAFVVPDMYDILLTNGRLASLSDLPVVQVQDLGLSALQGFIKRGADIVFAVTGIILASPVLIICAAVVRMSSPGPVIYRQKRMGLLGKEFYLYKFRTMVEGAEEGTGPVLSSAGDPRITKPGRFLRGTRLDELPQLVNILKGDMSLVGPRPERPFFADQFVDIIPDYDRRFLVRPGLTGLAQVYGVYSTTPEDKLRYDLYYIRNYSFFLDLKIIIRTLPILLDFEAAAGISDDSCHWLSNRLVNHESDR